MIEIGQVYRNLDPRVEKYGDGPARIKIVSAPGTVPGAPGFGKAVVVTLTDGGRELRRRPMDVRQLHESATTGSGQPRRSGYALEWS